MAKTQYTNIDQLTSNAKIVAALPTTPASYYGFTAGQEVGNTEWKGGELAFLTTTSLLHVQVATSGSTATWYKLNETFATTTTTSTSSSTTSSSSSTSSTTSTSTSTSSTSSTSTSTSSTTTP